MKYSLITFGCRVNQADSLAIEGQLRARGGSAATPDEADVLIVNTCSVTAAADQGARQTIRRVVRGNPDVRVVVTGCYATRMRDEVEALPNVARVVVNTSKDTLVADLAEELGLTTASRFAEGDGACGQALEPGVAGRTAFTLRVQTGCEERCSYCIIPQTRGASRSKPVDDVLRAIDAALVAGYKEIAITGVHLGSYGRDLPEPTSLTALLRALSQRSENVLFRVSSLEPMDCTPEIIDLVATSPRLAPHFHLPLQHASDRMLRAMRRPYTRTSYVSLIGRVARAMPHASIGTDIIVGFPGEREEDAAETEAVTRDLPLSHLHVFPYSDRPGTEATSMSEKVDGVAIRDRGRRLRAIGEEKSRRFREMQVGTSRRALTVDDGWSAVTDNYIKVRLDRRHARNEWVVVDL